MKTITTVVKSIEEAVKNDQVKLSWQDGRPVFIGWRKVTKREYYNEPWYKLGVPNSREVDDGSEWWFVKFNPRTAKYELDAPCGLFAPEVFADLPMLCHAKEIEQ